MERISELSVIVQAIIAAWDLEHGVRRRLAELNFLLNSLLDGNTAHEITKSHCPMGI